MHELVDRKHTGVVESPVFVDRYGRRRFLVIGAGVVVGLALAGWLALMVISLAVVFSDAPSPTPPG